MRPRGASHSQGKVVDEEREWGVVGEQHQVQIGYAARADRAILGARQVRGGGALGKDRHRRVGTRESRKIGSWGDLIMV